MVNLDNLRAVGFDCAFPSCKRKIREPNRFNLCLVHLETAQFVLWFLSKMQESREGRTASGIILPK